MSDLHTIGGLNESGMITLAHAETPESGISGFSRQYDSSSLGWTRSRWVRGVYIFRKQDLALIEAAIPVTPENLTTISGKKSDGTMADPVQWGAGYTLEDVQQSYLSPALLKVTAQWSRSVPEAEIVFPAGLVVATAAGVCTLTWKGTLQKTYDSGDTEFTGSIQFIKGPQITRRCTVRKAAADESVIYVQDMIRTYNTLYVYLNGVAVETVLALALEKSDGTQTTETYDPDYEPETLKSADETVGTDYTADLQWSVYGDTCTLQWASVAVWTFVPEEE